MEDKCKQCGKTSIRLFKCSGCMLARYCSQECQKNDWVSKHKQECQQHQDNQSVGDIISEEEVAVKIKSYLGKNWLKNPTFTACLIGVFQLIANTKGIFSLTVDHRELDGLLVGGDCPYYYSFSISKQRSVALGQYQDMLLTRQDGEMQIWICSTKKRNVNITTGLTEGITLVTGFGIKMKIPPLSALATLSTQYSMWLDRIKTTPQEAVRMFREGNCRLYPAEEGLRVIGGKMRLH